MALNVTRVHTQTSYVEDRWAWQKGQERFMDFNGVCFRVNEVLLFQSRTSDPLSFFSCLHALECFSAELHQNSCTASVCLPLILLMSLSRAKKYRGVNRIK